MTTGWAVSPVGREDTSFNLGGMGEPMQPGVDADRSALGNSGATPRAPRPSLASARPSFDMLSMVRNNMPVKPVRLRPPAGQPPTLPPTLPLPTLPLQRRAAEPPFAAGILGFFLPCLPLFMSITTTGSAWCGGPAVGAAAQTLGRQQAHPARGRNPAGPSPVRSGHPCSSVVAVV